MQTNTEPVLHDPVLADFPLALRVTCYPLGFPMTIESNSAEVMEAVHESWRSFTQQFDRPPVRMSLGVFKDGDAALPPLPKFRSREHLLSISADVDNFVVCDFARDYAFGWVTPVIASQRTLLRCHYLDPAALMLVQQRHLAAVHGALVAYQGRGILLCGESFAGKSTLSYACARTGWTFISDDAAFLMRDQSQRLGLGNPFRMRFREDARRLFPELADRITTVRTNGRIGVEVFTHDLPVTTATSSPIDHVVFLHRSQDAEAHLRPHEKAEAARYFDQFACYGDAGARAEQRDTYTRLLDADVWEMTYSDLDDAIRCLETLALSTEGK